VDACLSLMSNVIQKGQKMTGLSELLPDGLYALESRMDRGLERYNNNIYTPIFLLYFSLFPRVFSPYIRGLSFVNVNPPRHVENLSKNWPKTSQCLYSN